MFHSKQTIMKPGKLSFSGTIDTNQFWPQNSKTNNPYDSDADTVKVRIDISTVRFTNAAGISKKTRFLQDAGMFETDSKKNKVFKGVIDSRGTINMRLQGIDAPELHYMTGKPLYRQHMGNVATVKLFDFLKWNLTKSSSLIQCEVFTLVSKPNDVFDKYRRFVGDIIIKSKAGEKININDWLIEQGYAFPAFYNSMTNDEIIRIKSLADRAADKHLNIWKFYSAKMTALDRSLTHEKKVDDYDETGDKKSPVIFPKLFRRLWTYEIQTKNKFTTANYKKYLNGIKSDACCETKVFLKSGYPKKSPKLADFISADGTINFKPAELVFKEAGSRLVNKLNKPITVF